MVFKRKNSSEPVNSALLSIFMIVLVDVMAYTIIIPLLPFYAEKFGATPQMVGLLVTSFAFFQFLAGPLLGEISDRVGRKPVLMVSQAGTFIGLLILANAQSLIWIFASRIIDGITAGNLTVAQAFISDNTPPEKRVQSFAIIGISFGLGFLVGPGLSGLLSHYSLQAPIYASAFLSFTSIVLSFALLPKKETRAEAKARKHFLRTITNSFYPSTYAPFMKVPALRRVLIQFFLFSFAFVLFTSGFALFAERRLHYQGHPFTAKEVGYYLAYLGCVGVVIQARIVGWLGRIWGERKMALVGFMAMGLGYVLYSGVYSVPVLLVVGVVASFGTGTTRPALTSLITRTADKDVQGAVLGVSQSLGSIAQIIAPIISGFLIGHEWLSAWAITGGVFALLGALMD